jgi:hypothetical protein
MKNLIPIFFISYFFIGCGDALTPSLELMKGHKAVVTVNAISESGRPISDAQIRLYSYPDDLYNHRNQIEQTKYTDANGTVTFGWDENWNIDGSEYIIKYL